MVHGCLVRLEEDFECETVAQVRVVLRNYQVWGSLFDVPASKLRICDSCGSVTRYSTGEF